jgi:hypothetical protein
MEFPSDFDILSPLAARTVPWILMRLKGTSPINSNPAMIMRATQKKMISGAVTRSEVG